MSIVPYPVPLASAEFTVGLDKAPGVDDVVVTLKIYPGIPPGINIAGGTGAKQAVGQNYPGSQWVFSEDGNYVGFSMSNSITTTVVFKDREVSKVVSVPILPKYDSSSLFDNNKIFYVAIESVNENGVADPSLGSKMFSYAVIKYTAPKPKIEYVAPSIGNPNEEAINPPANSGGGGGDGDGCFTLNSKITMFDGSTKLLSDIVVGDKVQSGLGWGYNTVIDIERDICEPGRKLYSTIESEEPFITDNHPVYKNGKLVSLISEMSSTLYPWLGKISQVNPTSVRVVQKTTEVANLILDGDHTFVVNGIAVHNILEHGYLPTLIKTYTNCSFEEYQKMTILHNTELDYHTRMGYYITIMPLVKFCYKNSIVAKIISPIAKKIVLNKTMWKFSVKCFNIVGKIFFRKTEINNSNIANVEPI
jgi:hypothetical protein